MGIEPMNIQKNLRLPCGTELPNRIAKAAMTEGLADAEDSPTDALCRLYGKWSEGGAGLLISGNIMVDRRYLERGGNMVLEDDRHMEAYRQLTAAGKSGGNAFWAQINHPGRQCNKLVNTQPIAPSDVQLKLVGNFARPRAMNEADIEDLIQRFVTTAALVQEAGFDGVQIHSAHGYIGSEFLSPITNLRDDQWGGSLENRARFLLTTVERVRQQVGRHFPISVKLNSADFQKGGFELEDCQQVARWLCDRGIDLLEVSGGTYESLIWMDNSVESVGELRDTTKAREAFFLEYADAIRDATETPLMITGGFRQLATMEQAIANGSTDLIGIARPFCVDPTFPHKLLSGETDTAPCGEKGLLLGKGWLGPRSRFSAIRALNNQGQVAWFYQQILRLARDQPLMQNKPVLRSFVRHTINEIKVNQRRQFRA